MQSFYFAMQTTSTAKWRKVCRFSHLLCVSFGSLRRIFEVILHQPLYFFSDAPCHVMVGLVWGAWSPGRLQLRLRRSRLWESTFHQVRCLSLVKIYSTVKKRFLLFLWLFAVTDIQLLRDIHFFHYTDISAARGSLSMKPKRLPWKQNRKHYWGSLKRHKATEAN